MMTKGTVLFDDETADVPYVRGLGRFVIKQNRPLRQR